MNLGNLSRSVTKNSYFKVDLSKELKNHKNPFNSLISPIDRRVFTQDFDTIAEAIQYRRKCLKKGVSLDPINEALTKELKTGTEYKRKLRADGKLEVYGKKSVITVKYNGVSTKKGWILFETPSQKPGHKPYVQYIRLNDIKDLKYFKEYKQRDIIRLLLAGNISVFCSCLIGSTKIPLVDGTIDTIENLVRRYESGEALYVYSTNSKGDYRKGKVLRVWETKKVSSIFKVTLSNGEVVYCTKDHRFMLRDGSYVEAGSLYLGVALMPVYFEDNKDCDFINYDSKGMYSDIKKVVGTEEIILDKEIPVYDMTVEKYHNFYLNAGAVVHNCADFKYRYKYMAHTLGYGIFVETRPPKITNPRYKGTICKHLFSVLKVLGFNWSKIARDMQKTKYWKKHYDDTEDT